MSIKMPVVFVSHGAPDALLKAPESVACWRGIGQSMPRPKAILVVSAHWETSLPRVSLAAWPETIYDFSGFARSLYSLNYPAPGAPVLAGRVAELFLQAGLRLETQASRGLDHGAWVPLLAMFSEADIPVTQLSVQAAGDAASHLLMGSALRSLQEEGVLILASGAITHNFSWLNWNAAPGTPPLAKAKSFSDWIGAQIEKNDLSALQNFRQAPYGDEANPSDEHISPLFVALGVANAAPVVRYQPPFTYGALAMDAYVWR